jgi:hypothetical protein
MIGAILGGLYVVVIHVGLPGIKTWDIFEFYWDGLRKGTLFENIDSATIWAYGIGVFFIINAVLAVAMLLMLILCGGNLYKAIAFYSISVWYFLSTLGYTATMIYYLIDTTAKFGDIFGAMNYFALIPIGAAFFVMIVGALFKRLERNY